MTDRNRIRRSPNFKDGAFRNVSPTPVMAENVSYLKLISDSLHRPKTVRPAAALPSRKTTLPKSSDHPVITWFGHSSYLFQGGHKNILVDPVFSGHASPVSWMVKAFEGSDVYTTDDLPEIDLLIITHNHYDHLDTATITRLRDKIRLVYAPLGVGKDIPVDPRLVTELDWWESARAEPGIELTALPARHFSGRGLKRGGSLWASFALQIAGWRLYFGGDSGYDTHFRQIGDRYGPFDLAILECGQYNSSWPYIHMMPEQTAQAAVDLRARALMPVHWGKFTLANHPWNEPVQRVLKKAAELNLKVTTPMIGEPVVIGEPYPDQPWWNLSS